MKIFRKAKRLIKNRKAFELTINFVVMLILAIVMFGLGLRFLATFFTGGMKMQKQLDDQTKRNIELLLTAGERVAIPLDNKEVLRGQSEIIGIGISNVFSNNPADEFSIRIECVGSNCQNLPPTPVYLPKVTIENNKQYMEQVLFNVGKKTPSGTYIYNVCVTRGPENEQQSCQTGVYELNKLYDKSLHKIYIKVP